MRYLIWTLVFAVMFCGVAWGNDDLDDGIPMEEETVSDYDSLQKEVNMKYIIRKAKNDPKAKISANGNGGDANQNSVVLDPGAVVKGDIIIYSEGDNININER